MDAKQKAIELRDKFYFHAISGNPIDESAEEQLNLNAKACAIILVNEVIEKLDRLHKPEYVTFFPGNDLEENSDGYELQDFWNQVEVEILKL